jgi:hypothetical protein
MNIRYESDDRAIARVLDALSEGEIIDHGTARAIAAQYNEPGVCESFVSTGAMPTDDDDPANTLIYALFDGTAEHPDYGLRGAKAVEAYINDRAENGDYGPVEGWSDMWVPKHVDYPHEAGRLVDCLACEAECFCNPGIGWTPELGVTPCVYCAEQMDAFDSDRPCGCGAVGIHGVDHED